MNSFNDNAICVAIDFETADYFPDSACAVGLAKIQNKQVVDTWYATIRPPRKKIFFTHIHKLTWADLQHSPTFPEAWPEINIFLQGATHLVAHNASFDAKVLRATCEAFNLPAPELPFICTLRASRKILRLPSHSLDAVCKHLNIDLTHHHAESDAIAAAEVLLRLLELQQR